MFDANSAGRAQPRAKTINVEANLMAQRLSERRQMTNDCRRKVVTLVICVAVVGAISPPLLIWTQTATKKASVLAAKQSKLEAEVSSLQKLVEGARPALKETQLLSIVGQRADNYLGRAIQFVNNVEPDMALNSLKIQVLAGQMKVDAQANSENYKAYRSFIARCHAAVGQENVFPRAHRASALLGDDGLAFELEYRVKVGL